MDAQLFSGQLDTNKESRHDDSTLIRNVAIVELFGGELWSKSTLLS